MIEIRFDQIDWADTMTSILYYTENIYSRLKAKLLNLGFILTSENNIDIYTNDKYPILEYIRVTKSMVEGRINTFAISCRVHNLADTIHRNISINSPKGPWVIYIAENIFIYSTSGDFRTNKTLYAVTTEDKLISSIGAYTEVIPFSADANNITITPLIINNAGVRIENAIVVYSNSLEVSIGFGNMQIYNIYYIDDKKYRAIENNGQYSILYPCK